MHGRKKSSKPTPEQAAALAKKGENYAKLCAHALAAKAAKKADDKTWGVVEKLLCANPDVHTLWNYRREMIRARGGDAAVDAAPELALTERCLKKQPKSYGSWHHRLWAVRRSADPPSVARSELALCAAFLKLDERNFHCWNHRRAAAKIAGERASERLAFARSRLDANFSNYSAFHERAAALPAALDRDTARAELDLAKQALFCEPDDQSAWWYHAAILDRCGGDADLLDAELVSLHDLRALEPDAKWPAISLLRLLARNPDLAAPGERRGLHADLLRVDPGHAAMYGPPPPP